MTPARPCSHAQHSEPYHRQRRCQDRDGHSRQGVDFLLNDAKDENDEPYQAQVAGLKEKRIDFRVCRKTPRGRNLDGSAVVMDATVVLSGVAEIGKLQAREGSYT